MKLARFEAEGRRRLGVVHGDQVSDLTAVVRCEIDGIGAIENRVASRGQLSMG
jgi:2-keto-4-pentenoate hydratase/2-oxohepta-3-ene-1,7-dioic acid hydratase in catechol pathway